MYSEGGAIRNNKRLIWTSEIWEWHQPVKEVTFPYISGRRFFLYADMSITITEYTKGNPLCPKEFLHEPHSDKTTLCCRLPNGTFKAHLHT